MDIYNTSTIFSFFSFLVFSVCLSLYQPDYPLKDCRLLDLGLSSVNHAQDDKTSEVRYLGDSLHSEHHLLTKYTARLPKEAKATNCSRILVFWLSDRN